MAILNEPMTFEDLSQLYRQELNSNCIIAVRKDLYRAVANLLTNLRQTYERLLSEDPESVMCDGANTNFKNAESQWKKIVNIRAKKICSLAIRTAGGNVESIDVLSDDEIEYFQAVVANTRDILNRVNNLRGKKTRDTHIDEDFNTPRVVAEPPKPVEVEIPPAVNDDEFFDEGYDEPILDPEDFPIDMPPMDQEDVVPAQVEVQSMTKSSQEETCVDPLSTEDDAEEVSEEFVPILIRILEDLPEFAGPFRTYRLSKEDIITMPKVMAESLVNNGKAVPVRPSS